MERCKNCHEYYNQGYSDGRASEDRYDTILTAPEVLEMVEAGGRLEGHWAITVQVPYGINPFGHDRLWIEILNTLTEACGVKITSLKFKLKQNVAGYQFAMKEE